MTSASAYPGRLGRALPAVAGVAVMAAFAAGVLWGLRWGVPSRRRAALEGGAELIRDVPDELLRHSWDHWGSRGRRSAAARAFPRHLFNPLRSYHPDEYQVFKSLGQMAPGRLDFDPGNYIYPSLHTYLVGGVLGVTWLAGGVRLEREVRFYFEHPEEMGRLYVAGRALSLLVALGTLGLVWRLGGRGVGLLALALLATMPGLAAHSHNLTRDTCAALAAVALYGCCRRLAHTGKARWYDLAGAAAGLCVAFQYYAVVLWTLVPVAGLRSRREHRLRLRTVLGRCAAALVVMAVVFCIACPYHVLNAGQFVADFRSETGHLGAGSRPWARLAPIRMVGHLFGMLPALVSWPGTVLVCVGVVVALARREEDDMLLLVWLLLLMAVVGFDGRVYSRYYVPLLPCLALLGARALGYGGQGLGHVVASRRLRRALGGAAVAGLLAVPAATSFGWCRLYSRVNVRTLAGEAIAADVPAGSRIGLTEWPWQFEIPPLDPARVRLVVLEDSPRGDPYDLARLRRLHPEYFVTSSLQYGRIRERPEITCPVDQFWARLLVRQKDYVVWREYRVPLRVLGRAVDLAGYPEDMRYVNPEIVVLQWAAAEAVARGAPPGGGP